MTIPTVSQIGSYASGGTSTSHSANYPAGAVTSGRLLIALGGNDGSSPDVLTWAGETDETVLDSTNPGGIGGFVGYRTAGGSEGGTTTNFTVNTAEDVAIAILEILNWDGVTAPEMTAANSGASSAPDSPSLPVSWSDDTLFISFFSGDGNRTISAYPTGYTDNQTILSPATNFIGFATKGVSSHSGAEDPAAYTLSSGTTWRAYTIAIRGASAGGGGGSLPPFGGMIGGLGIGLIK